MKIGFIDDATGATQRVKILDETKSGRYVAQRQVYMNDGIKDYWRNYGEVFLISKDKVKEEKDESLG